MERDGCGRSCITCCEVPTGYRFDALIGYRFLRLDDEVRVVEDLVSTDTSQPAGAFIVRDDFRTENQFHGVDFGASLRFCKGCFTFDLLSKVAFGTVHTQVDINGSTVITQNGQAQTFQGGLLAQLGQGPRADGEDTPLVRAGPPRRGLHWVG